MNSRNYTFKPSISVTVSIFEKKNKFPDTFKIAVYNCNNTVQCYCYTLFYNSNLL